MPGVSAALRKRKQKPRKNKERAPWDKPRGKKSKKEDDSDAVESQTEEDYSDTNEERKEEYRKGGYHPVAQGELYNSRYRTAHKLGWGYFSTVWLVWDYIDKDFKAMKVQKGAQHYREAAFDEIKLLDQIMKGDPHLEKCCCAMTDSFEHKGPNGKHVVMVFRVLGENLLSLITKYDYKGTPLRLIRPIAKQILIGLDYLHRELADHPHGFKAGERPAADALLKKIRKIMESYTAPPIDRQLLSDGEGPEHAEQSAGASG
ncbi:Serine/threonine-protein kinase SRPK [Diplonema papillatum]|nr:Serine/threonine-protein kinase SRPK [Diplonema papillatum]